ncbi:zinc ribbon domain-containing protein [Gemmiger formicilis]|uniref:zinc ribbon domain-containing protein n=1 Tax=Gemmiger formicilis TaxID=745368 RepID=UPI00195BF055|nr:zinc ribbon domain-containing protein [Gemmiger formicilis]MBM6717862.1 zinc ribbon domain-containing protein [Gemmiger formicilis]
MLLFCKHCGLLLPAHQTVCPRCGTPAPQSSAPADQPLYASTAPQPSAAPTEGPRYQAAAPKKRGPMGLAGYFGSLLLFAVPVVGLIFMLIWSVSDRVRPERHRLAQAYLIRTVIFSALLLVAALVFSAIMSNIAYRMVYYPYYF